MGKKVLATVLACVLMLMSFNIVSTALSMEHSEKNLSKEVLLNQFNRTAPKEELLRSTQTSTVSTFEELQTAVNNPDVIWIYIANDIQMEDTLTINRSIVLSALSNEVVLTSPNITDARHFNVNGNQEIQLIFAQVVLRGYKNDDETTISGGIYNTATSLIVRNANITGCCNEEQGGGINSIGPNLVLFGCKLSFNTAHWGGGIYCRNASLYDVEIFNNDAISGGGIFASTTLYAENIIVSYNHAKTGGGMDLFSKTDIRKSQISYNTADSAGGGIEFFHFQSTEMKILDCKINCNSASNGAGINYTDIETTQSVNIILNLTGTQIFENVARQDGGGVSSYLSRNGNNIVINGGEFKNNIASSGRGGAILCATAVLNSNVIDSNQAVGGGGIYSYGKLTINDGVIIQNNISEQNGGGIYGKEIAILGGTIQDNQSGRNGGGIYGSTVMLINGDITNNQCDEYGGGIYVESDGTLVLFGGSVSNNTAGIDGNDTYKA